MRWVFIGIVALNLLYLGWHLLGPDDEEVSALPPAEMPAGQAFPAPLALLGESAAPPAPSASPTPAPVVTGCPAVGPFGKDDATAVVEALGAAGFDAAELAVQRDGTPVFWVYLPAAPSRQQALRQLRELHAKGVDSFVVTEGPDVNAISLGSFTSRDSAIGVQGRLRSSGYAAEVREQVRDVRQTWVVLADPAAQGFLEFVPTPLQAAARIERQACPRTR